MKTRLRGAVLLAAILASSIGISAKQGAAPRRIEIEASKFSYSPKEITLKKGETVVLVLSSTDVTHGLKIKEFGVKVEAKKGHSEEVTVTPTQTGHFEGKCSHFCGMGHGSMTLAINVVE